MRNSLSLSDRIAGAIYGMCIADALAMPVHWYYNTQLLRRDYGEVRDYLQPRNPHPDSILWRSSWSPSHHSADILHDQKKYWGEREIHYHQFLKAGENTLNIQLAVQLLSLIQRENGYLAESWLKLLVEFMTNPGSHNDTYIEEYLRHFFTRYGRGEDLFNCGIENEKHIGGLILMLPLLTTFACNPDYARSTALDHLSLTHGGRIMQQGGEIIAEILLRVLAGEPLSSAISSYGEETEYNIARHPFASLAHYPDHVVVGSHFSTACYLDQALPATLYLACKYSDDVETGLIVNTMCGGDNCGRGAVLGALLGAENGLKVWPSRWRDRLHAPPPEVKPDSLTKN